MKNTITTTICIIILCCLISCIPKKNTAAEYRELAGEYSANVKIKKSARALEKAIELDPNDIDTYISLAEAIQIGWNSSTKTRQKVHDAYNKALKIEPWSPKVLLSRAKFHEMNASYKLAEQDLDTVLRKEPANTEAYLLKAELHFFRKDTSGFEVLKKGNFLVSAENRDRIVHARAVKEFNLGLYYRSINSFKLELALSNENKNKNSIYCALAGAYLNIDEKDSACYYYKMCEYQWYYLKIDTKQLNELCGKNK